LKKGYSLRNFDLNPPEEKLKNVKFIQGDIRNLIQIKRATKGVDVIFHNVAQVPLAKNKYLFNSVNIDGIRNLLKAAKSNNCKKVVYTSSSAVYGIPRKNPVLETDLPEPKEAYGLAKYEGELICDMYVKKGLDISIIRPRTIMGHGRLGIFHILFDWVSLGKNIPVFNGGNNIYQFVHADDLADACILASEKRGSEIYNCGTNDFGSMREVLQELCLYANTGSKVISVPMFLMVFGMKITSLLGFSPLGAYHALMYGRSMYFDTTKARIDLGWTPKYSNREMFIESYKWYLKNKKNLNNSAMTKSHHKSTVKQGVLKIVSIFL
jgi:nucleoside-diphosphate-sugar epimerase